MIISVRGTHGSGKSTIVRKVIDSVTVREPIMHIGFPERKRPFGYALRDIRLVRPVVVLGHYETPSGGCDNIPAVEAMYSFARDQAIAGGHVLMEGILAQHYALKKFLTFSEFDLRVLVLNTPLEQCMADVITRRGETDAERQRKIFSTVAREYKNVLNGAKRLQDNNVNVRYVDRDTAFSTILQLLGLENDQRTGVLPNSEGTVSDQISEGSGQTKALDQ